MDRRLVQTAVVDSADSEDPVILPEDHRDLDEFRRFYWDRTFWCGTLLGGCGRELTTKRYLDRVCHFAHIADADEGPSECSRGVESADHLYIKRAMQGWLADRGRRYTGILLGDRHDEAIEFTEVDTASRLRIQLAPMDPDDWRRLRGATDESSQRVQWILRGNHHLLDQIVEHDGHALSVACETVGTAIPTREVWIRTRNRLGRTDWIPLTQCELSDDGAVKTPSTLSRDESEPSMAEPREMRLPLLPERIRFTLANEGPPPTPATTGRTTYRVRLMAGGTQRPALLSLAGEALRPERHQTYQLIRAASIVLLAAGTNAETWRIDAEGIRLESNDRITSRINEQSAPKSRVQLRNTSVRATNEGLASPAHRTTTRRDSTLRYLENIATLVEGALVQAASDGRRVTWREIGTAVGRGVSIERLGDGERVSILSMIERGRTQDSPLLSVVLVAGQPDIPLPYLTHIDRVRDLIPPGTRRDLAPWCREQFERTHDAYATKPSTNTAPQAPPDRPAPRPQGAPRPIPAPGSPERAAYDRLLFSAARAKHALDLAKEEFLYGSISNDVLLKRMVDFRSAQLRLAPFHDEPELTGEIENVANRLSSPDTRFTQRRGVADEARRRGEQQGGKDSSSNAGIDPRGFGPYTDQEVESIAEQVRDELISCARSKSTPTWRAVCERVGRSELGSMKARALARIMVRVDTATPQDQPLLSTLLAVGDPGRLSAWRRAAHFLGREVPADKETLERQHRSDVQRIYERWRQS